MGSYNKSVVTLESGCSSRPGSSKTLKAAPEDGEIEAAYAVDACPPALQAPELVAIELDASIDRAARIR